MKEQLKPYLDGELDSVNRIEFEALLKASPELQREADDFSQISDSLKTADSGVPYGKDELMKKLAQPAASESNRKLWRTAWIWSGSMACLVVAAMMWKPMAKSGNSSFESAGSADAAMATATTMAKTPLGGQAAPMSEESSTPESLQDGLQGQLEEAAKKTKALTAEPKSLNGYANSSADYSGVVRDGMRTSTSMSLDTPAGIYVERQGDIQVKVQDLSQTVDLTIGIAKSLDGFIVSSNLSKKEDGGEANVILRVPTTNFTTAINKIQAAGEVISMNNSSQDITSETVDSNSRMNYWAVEEQRLIEALKKSKESRKWEIRQELNNVRANLESQRAMVKSLRDRAKYSTIQAKFVSGDVGGKSSWAKNTFKDAKGGLGSIGEVLGIMGIYTLVFIPVWLPLVIVAYIVKKRQS